MDVQLLVVPDCPNESVAPSVLRSAFERVGLAAQSSLAVAEPPSNAQAAARLARSPRPALANIQVDSKVTISR